MGSRLSALAYWGVVNYVTGWIRDVDGMAWPIAWSMSRTGLVRLCYRWNFSESENVFPILRSMKRLFFMAVIVRTYWAGPFVVIRDREELSDERIRAQHSQERNL